MTYQLRFSYDERDFLEIWLPGAEKDSTIHREPGLYEIGTCAKNPGNDHAFDSLMLDAFSKAYPRILAEVLKKESPVEKESYNSVELGLYGVSLSRILKEIYRRFVEKPEKFSASEMISH